MLWTDQMRQMTSYHSVFSLSRRSHDKRNNQRDHPQQTTGYKLLCQEAMVAFFFNQLMEFSFCYIVDLMKHGSRPLPPPDELPLSDRLGGEELGSEIPRSAQSAPREPETVFNLFVMLWIHTIQSFMMMLSCVKSI